MYVVTLVEVESPLHADTLAATQLPEHQLTGMPLHCTAQTKFEQLIVCLYSFRTLAVSFRLQAIYQRGLASADGKTWNILILELSPVLQQVSQTAEAWTTDDGDFRALLCVGKQPVCCLLILVVSVAESNGGKKDSCEISLNHSSDSDESVAYLYDNYHHNYHHHYHRGVNTINTNQLRSHI